MKIPDASLAVKWIAPEDDSEHAVALLAEWTRRDETIVAPTLIRYEVTNILRKKMRREGLSAANAAVLLERFLALPIALPPDPDWLAAQLHHDALELAARFDLPATYDAHYVALALALDCELWTADEKLLGQLAGRITNVSALRDFAPS